jgi:hypothetical protein
MSTKISKRYKALSATVVPGKTYAIDEAIKIVKDGAKAKFPESVDVAIRLGIDAKKSDQGVRGSVMMPHGTGKTVKVAVFCPAGEKAEAAKAAGADAVGMEDLAERMQAGELDFGRVIATPDAMRVVGKLGQLLGPRGLMPNPRTARSRPTLSPQSRTRRQARSSSATTRPASSIARSARLRSKRLRSRTTSTRCSPTSSSPSRLRRRASTCRRSRSRARWAWAFRSTRRRFRPDRSGGCVRRPSENRRSGPQGPLRSLEASRGLETFQREAARIAGSFFEF